MTTRQKSKKVPVPVSFQQIQMNAGAMEHPISSFKWNVVVPKYSIPNLFPVQDIRRKFVHEFVHGKINWNNWSNENVAAKLVVGNFELCENANSQVLFVTIPVLFVTLPV